MATLLDFHIGDVVEALVNGPSGNGRIKAGDIGVVSGDPGNHKGHINYDQVRVDWGRDVDGHSCGGWCKPGNGWNVNPDQIQLVDEILPMLTAEELYALMDEEDVA